MAEFAFLAYYKDYPADKAIRKTTRGQSLTGYEKLFQRQRGASMCSNLTPVMEHEAVETVAAVKKSKRRFSLDALFSKKKKQDKAKDKGKRGSTDSTSSVENENINQTQKSNARKDSTTSLKMSKNAADLTAYCFT